MLSAGSFLHKFKKIFTGLLPPTTLRFRLTALVLLITVLVLIAAAVFIDTRAVAIIEEHASEQLDVSNRTLAATASVWLELHLNVLKNLIALPDIVSMNAERQKPFLQNMMAAYPYVYLASTTDLMGMNVARSDQKKLMNYSDRSWFRKAREGDPVVFESLIGRTIGRSALVVSMPIKNREGRIVGVGMFATDLERLADQVRSSLVGKTGFGYLVDQQNRVIAHPNPLYTGELRDLSDYPPVAALRRGTQGQMHFHDEAGRRWQAFVSTLDNGWGIVVQQQEDELLSERRLFQTVFFLIIVFAVLVLALTTWLVVRQALQPIETLTNAVKGVGSDLLGYSDLASVHSASLSIHTRDEVGTLAQSFSTMIGLLQTTLMSLEQELNEHKHAEALLRESEEKYRSLVDNIALGVFRATGGPHGRFLQVNQAMVKMFGYDSLDEFLGLTASDLYQNPEERESFVKEITRDGFVKNRERALRKKDGTPIWCSCTATVQYDEQGDGMFLDGVLEDITERKKSEEALKESEKKFRELFEESKDAIFIGSPEGKFTDINAAGVELTGHASKTEIIGKDITNDLFDITEEKLQLQSELQKRGFVKDYELMFRRKDGKKLKVLMTATAVRDATGGVIAYRGIIRDVTNQRRLEEQLFQAQKMEAIGQLSGGIAHDFNNILTAIMGYASLLNVQIQQDSPFHLYVDQILTASTRAKNLTRNLLTFSRKQVMNPGPVSVNEIITNIKKMLVQIIREDIDLKTVLADEDLTIMADSGQIEQVLINLAANARDSMPQGGALTIETKRVDADAGYAKNQYVPKQGKQVCISVTDTGTGMDANTKGKIFEPFFTTKELGKGTGLGLSIVYGIVKQHEGSVHVYSEPGLGTTFKIYFPAITSKPEETRSLELPEPTGGVETILLAEDDASVRRLTKTILTEAGYTVLEAANGEEALTLFSENKDAIQLVLLDVIMPKKNGKEVYDWIRNVRPGVRTLFMSGYSADIIFKKGVLEKGLNLISKPTTSYELLRKVREVLDKTPDDDKAAGDELPENIVQPVLSDKREQQPASTKRTREGFVMIVDDDPQVREYVSLVLKENGYTTVICDSAHDAVEKLKDIRPDIVVTDIVMPGASGFELLETVQSIDPDIPVILVTAYADLGKAVESIKKGAYDFIMKPYDVEQLLCSLDKALRYRKLTRIEKEYQSRLEEFNKEMETLVAERSMNLMALTVADQVRNPVTVIGLACKKITDKGASGELKKYVKFIRNEADKLETMVKSFQNLLEKRQSVFVYEDINDVVRNILALLEKESLGKRIQLILHLAERPLKIHMRKSLLHIAVQHVLRNAMEATPPGGRVTITSTAENHNVVVLVEDTGSGIVQQDIEKVFSPFYSTKTHRYGMGLPLVRQVVFEHRGEIDLKSEVGKGTTVRLVFPSQWQEK